MKKIFFGILILTAGFVSKAQQVQQYSQYLFNEYALNPAVAGSRDYYEGVLDYREQWVGIVDAPRTIVTSVNGPLSYENMGVGGTIFNDIVGPTRRTGFLLSYAYHFKLNETMNLGLGLAGGVQQFMIDGGKLRTKDDDLALSGGIMSVIVPDATFGAYFYSDKYYVGLSAPQLIPWKLQFFDDYSQTQSRLSNHFFAYGGYKFDINDDFILEPSALVKYVSPVPPQIDASLRVWYKNMVWLGSTYRTQDAISIMAGYTFQENISVGYSYDMTTSNLKNYSSGTHELMIGIRFKKRHDVVHAKTAEE